MTLGILKLRFHTKTARECRKREHSNGSRCEISRIRSAAVETCRYIEVYVIIAVSTECINAGLPTKLLATVGVLSYIYCHSCE
jgi:hypothetical protein